jgi:hypothetical protein
MGGFGGSRGKPSDGSGVHFLNIVQDDQYGGGTLFIKYFSLYSVYVQYKSFAKLTFYYYVKVRRGHAGRDARLFPGGPGAGRRVWVTDAFSVHRGMLAVI